MPPDSLRCEGNRIWILRLFEGGKKAVLFCNCTGSEEDKDSSFLKKRSKKLLPMASGVSFDVATRVLAETDKSFLVLFFKKEHFFPLRLQPTAMKRDTQQGVAAIDCENRGCVIRRWQAIVRSTHGQAGASAFHAP